MKFISILKHRRLLFCIAAALASQTAHAQLRGSKNIPGDYATLSSAVADLNANGVGAGGVTFNIAAAHMETVANLTITTNTADATKPIVFQKSGAGVNPRFTASAGVGTLDGIFKVVGTDYVTFDGLDIRESPTNTTSTTRMEWGIALLRADGNNGSQHVTVRNCYISLNYMNTASCGIYSGNHGVGSATSLVITSASGTNSFNTFDDNIIAGSYNGIFLKGFFQSRYFDQENQIGVNSANFIYAFGGGNIAAHGVYTEFQNKVRIEHNDIAHHPGTTASIYGIRNVSSGEAVIDSNVIMISSGNASGHAVNGIANSSDANTCTISRNVIHNSDYLKSGMSSHFYAIEDAGVPAGGTRHIFGNRIEGNIMSEGKWYGIYMSVSNGAAEIHDNVISHNVKDRGEMHLIWSSNKNVHVYNNTLSEDTLSGTISYASIFTGIYQSNPASADEVFEHNDIHSLVLNSNGNGQLRGIQTEGGKSARKAIWGNTISNLSTRQGKPAAISVHGGVGCQIYNNEIYDLDQKSPATSSPIAAIIHTGGSITNIYNNVISGIQSTSATLPTAVTAIQNDDGLNLNLYHNTIYLDAANNGNELISSILLNNQAATSVEAINNIFVNASLPGTNGLSAITIANATVKQMMGLASNNNLLYAGQPDLQHAIFLDQANGDKYVTLADYKTAGVSIESNSVTEDPIFNDVTKFPYDLRLNKTIATGASKGLPLISTLPAISKDFDGVSRSGVMPFMGAFEGNPATAISNQSPFTRDVRKWMVSVQPDTRNTFINRIVNESSAADVRVVSLNGAVLYHASVNTLSTILPTQSLPTGLYLVIIQSGAHKEVAKIVLP